MTFSDHFKPTIFSRKPVGAVLLAPSVAGFGVSVVDSHGGWPQRVGTAVEVL